MSHSYSMSAVRGAAERAVLLAKEHLLSRAPGSLVHDVQADPRFQHRGIDLLWEKGPGEVVSIEVKGDRRGGRRGNYFFELVSNVEKNTPGCFLYSEAEWLLYLFLPKLELHELPLKPTRAWFLERAREFPLRHARTQLGKEGYTTVGALVPVVSVLKAVAGARATRLTSSAPAAAASPRSTGG